MTGDAVDCTTTQPLADGCPRYSTLMREAQALVGAPRGVTFEGKWAARLRPCLKCPECGYSEELSPG
jgi:hypothetical protein